jgi:predicted nuclease of predicted toxin-antitoxin system
MMKLLLDQGLPRSAARLLREFGYVAFHVGDLDLSAASDAQILDRALSEGFVVVTLDADFHMLLALSSASNPSVIRLRIEGLKAGALVKILQTVIKSCEADLLSGAAITVEANRIRVRNLPLLP